jgi:hypothetical protein
MGDTTGGTLEPDTVRGTGMAGRRGTLARIGRDAVDAGSVVMR